MTMPLDSDMTVDEMLEHLDEIKSRQKTVYQDAAVRMAMAIIRHLVTCRICDGSGTMMVPDESMESASEYACPNPLHNYDGRQIT